ncbi:hypothetical protein [Paenibacillus piri]|uniref:Uncharacterized protein n=1 Tax=Paenibacillus piri TaxID=2547395 RepID=A0A4R5KBE2_9BACL|nr:hypothetical protein [Paenibacillus piri]TDF91845.1 hypothetical protein E1757_31380 [Paenibacillus piri]
MNADGSVRIPLLTSNYPVTGLHYRQGWIYMTLGYFGMQRSSFIDKLRIDGTGQKGLGEARAASLYFAGPTLYLSENHWMSSNTIVSADVK